MIHGRARILCVDDDPEVCQLLAAWLPDFRIRSEGNVADGLRAAFDGAFDLYMLDTWLPDGDGIEMCGRIREFDPNAPIVFFSAVAHQEVRRRALEAGATAYLTKPLEFEALCGSIPQHISATRAHSRDAVREELRAVETGLVDRVRESRERYDASSLRYKTARDEAALRYNGTREKIKPAVCRAFLEGGGTRAQFERIWPGMLLTPLALARFLDGNGQLSAG